MLVKFMECQLHWNDEPINGNPGSTRIEFRPREFIGFF